MLPSEIIELAKKQPKLKHTEPKEKLLKLKFWAEGAAERNIDCPLEDEEGWFFGKPISEFLCQTSENTDEDDWHKLHWNILEQAFYDRQCTEDELYALLEKRGLVPEGGPEAQIEKIDMVAMIRNWNCAWREKEAQRELSTYGIQCSKQENAWETWRIFKMALR